MARRPELVKVEETRAAIEELREFASTAALTNPSRKSLLGSISDMQELLDRLTRELDPVALPDSFFDPTEPRLIGHFVALALIAQDRRPLADVSKAYGSGVYAIYYTGDAEIYKPISGSETPIYVGKATPPANAKSVIEQGTKLTDRLNEHRKNIAKVGGVNIEDFECRALAVQSGYQASAEIHLIKLFEPIWNSETKILFGIGKHGDDASTRSNNKSPWDTIHPGRVWADGNPEAKSVGEILTEVADHFNRAKIFMKPEDVFEAFAHGIKQQDQLSPEVDAAK